MKNIGVKVEKELDSYHIDQEGDVLFLNTIYINPFQETQDSSNPLISYEPCSKKEYEDFERIMDDHVIEKDKYIVYGSYDVGGYDYWREQSLKYDDLNYISILIRIKDCNAIQDKDISEIAQDIDLYVDTLLDKLDSILLVDTEYLY